VAKAVLIGAIPPLMGWTAATGHLALPGWIAFAVVFLWQFPHFMAIAWIYRRQYAAAGLQMLTVVDATGRRAGAQAVLGVLALLPISLLPALQTVGGLYVIGAVGLGSAYLISAAMFFWRRDDRSARLLLQTSLVYLPALLALLILSPFV
jgi:protoheme IX farnesyltransferase